MSTQIKIKRKTHIIDARKENLGRLATKVSQLLMGKHKTEYTPHLDLGDFVMVINAKDIKVTGKKFFQKKYYHYSGYPGGLKQETFREKMIKPAGASWIIRHAVYGMLPKNRLITQRMKRLKIYLETPKDFKAKN